MIVNVPARRGRLPIFKALHVAREAGITHEAVNLQAGIRVRGAIHVQNVNACHSRLRGWLQPFCGVASRYLGHYLGWRRALDGGRVKTPGRPAARGARHLPHLTRTAPDVL
jgi:hypothetical protein